MQPALTPSATASARPYGPPNASPHASAYQHDLDAWFGGKTERQAARERILAWIVNGDESKVLNLGSLSLDELPPLPPGIRKLKADRNNLTSAPEDLPYTLEALDLHGNCLLRLPESLPFASLRLLNVAGNAIEQLPASLRLLDANCKVYLTDNPIPQERIDKLFGTPQNTNGLRYPRQRASAAPPGQTLGANTPAPPKASGYVAQITLNLGDLIVQAVNEGNTASVRQLLQLGSCDINAPWERCPDFNFLGIAMNKKNLDMVKLLLEQPGIDPNRGGSSGRCPPLNAAVMEKCPDILAALLAHPDIDPNVDTRLQLSPLYVAIEHGETEMAKQLLKHPKTNPNLGGPASLGNTPLTVAVNQGNLALTLALLDHRDIDPNLACADGGPSPLYLACQKGFAPIAAALLKHPRIQPNATDTRLNTPLHIAASEGHLPVVQTLLADPRVDAHLRADGKHTPLYIAASQGHADIVDCLLKRKNKRVDPNLGSTEASTPLIVAVRNGHEKAVSRLLAEKSVRVNARSGPPKVPPLGAAIGMRNASMVKLLLSSERIDPNLKSSDTGMTPLQFAVTFGEMSVIQTLLNDPRVDVNRKSDTDVDALCMAVAAKREDIVVALIEHGARIEGLSKPRDRQFAMLALGKACLSALTTEINAQALLDKLAQMPQQDAALRLAAIAMQSAQAPLGKTLEDLPLLKRAILLDRPGLREAVSGLLGAWGASLLGDRGKLPPLTRDILAAWDL